MKNAKYGVPAVQSYAFGGIANPTQMATLRSSDKEYLDARQKELDEFEKQRIAYNDSLAKWQTEVYNPYKTQLDAYNAAAEKYNAGPRTEDFTLSVPVTPEDFKMAAPVVPFKEEEVVARQKEAAARATQDAGNRAVAIDVVSDPDRFNFGSMSVSNRFMAQGGEVKSMADDVAAAGRNGDELLAYLSPEALRLLKENGGSGTINPETGLPEFFSDTLKNILVELPKLEAAAAAEKAAAEKAAADAKELADFRAKEAAVSARWNEAVPSKPATTTAAADLDTAIRQLKAGDNAAANLTMRQIVGLDPIPSTAIPNTPVAKPVPTFGQAPAIKTAPVATPGQTPAIKTAPVATFTPAVPPPPPGPRPPSRADETEWSAKSRPKSEPVIDMQVVVYGPDGKMYSSPAQARTAGVTNYTMEPPKAPPVTPPAATVPRSAPISTPSIPYTPPAMPGQVQPGMRNPASQPAADIPISMPTMPTYSSRGVGAVGTADSVANKNYFALTPETSTGLAPGSAAIGPADMPLAGARGTLNAMGLNKNLSPTMLGGAQNAGYTTDRLGNRIYGFARGGGVDVNALMAQNTETLSDEVPDDVINTDPVGTAQKMLADLGNVGKVSPTRQAIRRVRTAPGGGATADKSMQMPYEGLGKGDLGAMKDVTPASKNTDSARAQMEELARVYQLKIRAAQNKGKGLSADTFGAPTLEGPTLTKSKLTKKRFKDGGEARAPEGELSQEEIDAASRPAFVTPKSGKGRKQGEISKQLKSGDAYINMAKGVTELPYDLAGAPVDLATMAMRPFGYGTEKPVMGSDFIKEKMTKLGVRPEPPADPTAKGFYTAGELLSNLVNPAGVTRAGVKAAEKTGKAATEVAKDFQQYNRQLSVPGASYAVRPTGSTVLTGPVGFNKDVSGVDQLLQNGISNAGNVAGQGTGQAKLIADFWDKKARNYFTRQFGTPDDPIARDIASKKIKGTALEEMFPEYLIDQIAAGKMRYKEGARPEGFVGPGAPEGRFFPKYPRAMEDLTKRYDQATGLKGNLVTTDPALSDPQYAYSLSARGRAFAEKASEREADKLLLQGVRPDLINTSVGVVTRNPQKPDRIVSVDTTGSAKDLYSAFEEASEYNKMTPEQQAAWANEQFGNGRRVHGLEYGDIGKNILPENILTAIQKGEPVYDFEYMREPLSTLFKPASINQYLATLSPRELANIRFEDAVRGGLKLTERSSQLNNAAERIRAGKPVADSVFSEGVSKPLLQFGEGSGFDGFAWKRIENREATMPEGAYVGHSVGGYETGGIGYPKEKQEGFNTGKYQVYTLRDNRNRPVTTVEVQMVDEMTPVVMQIKGNGRATGNTAPEKYDGPVLRFLQDYLKPAAINEKDEFLTPILQNYKEGVNAGFKMP